MASSGFPTYSQMNVGLFGLSSQPPISYEEEMLEAGVYLANNRALMLDKRRGADGDNSDDDGDNVDQQQEQQQQQQQQQEQQEQQGGGKNGQSQSRAGQQVSQHHRGRQQHGDDVSQQPRLRRRSHHSSLHHIMKYDAHAQQQEKKRPNPHAKQGKGVGGGRGAGGGGGATAAGAGGGPGLNHVELAARELLPRVEAIELHRTFDAGGAFWQRVGEQKQHQQQRHGAIDLCEAATVAAGQVGTTAHVYRAPRNLARPPPKLAEAMGVSKAATVRRLPRSLVGPYGAVGGDL